MDHLLSPARRREFLERGFSRRDLLRITTVIGAGATLPFFGEAALAQISQVAGMPADAIKLNANENPLGPCPEAIEAMTKILSEGGRYHYELTGQFAELLASQEGLSVDQVRPFAGSSAPLTQAVLAFTSPTKSLVTADPGYEQAEWTAKFIGAKVARVPLTKTYAHDVKGMVEAGPDGGLFYVCNPNNPTGTLTPDADIDWLVDHLPAGAVLLLDEAYIHISGARMRSDLVRAGKPVVLLRTFSKLYGMAGLRAGAAIARPDLLERITPYSSGALPITGVAAAIASLKVPDLVEKRRTLIGDTRASVFSFLDRKGYSYVPSVSNKFMVDVRQPGERVIMSLRQERVYIGRVWPSWPTYVRVTIGTPEEMEKFQAAFTKVMA